MLLLYLLYYNLFNFSTTHKVIAFLFSLYRITNTLFDPSVIESTNKLEDTELKVIVTHEYSDIIIITDIISYISVKES